jgi:hypothetical protein
MGAALATPRTVEFRNVHDVKRATAAGKREATGPWTDLETLLERLFESKVQEWKLAVDVSFRRTPAAFVGSEKCLKTESADTGNQSNASGHCAYYDGISILIERAIRQC